MTRVMPQAFQAVAGI